MDKARGSSWFSLQQEAGHDPHVSSIWGLAVLLDPLFFSRLQREAVEIEASNRYDTPVGHAKTYRVPVGHAKTYRVSSVTELIEDTPFSSS